jgi:hypothetical protein
MTAMVHTCHTGSPFPAVELYGQQLACLSCNRHCYSNNPSGMTAALFMACTPGLHT